MALIGLILGIDTNYGIRSSNLISDFIDDVIMSHFGVTLDDVIENLYNLYKHGNLIKTRNKG